MTALTRQTENDDVFMPRFYDNDNDEVFFFLGCCSFCCLIQCQKNFCSLINFNSFSARFCVLVFNLFFWSCCCCCYSCCCCCCYTFKLLSFIICQLNQNNHLTDRYIEDKQIHPSFLLSVRHNNCLFFCSKVVASKLKMKDLLHELCIPLCCMCVCRCVCVRVYLEIN